MTVQWKDGFDPYGAMNFSAPLAGVPWQPSLAAPQLSFAAAAARTGTFGFRANNVSRYIERAILGAPTDVGLGGAIRYDLVPPGFSTSAGIGVASDTGVVIKTLPIPNAGGVIGLYRDSTLIAQTNFALGVDTYYHAELLIDNSGAYDWRIRGQQIATGNMGSVGNNFLTVRLGGTSSGNSIFDFDDIYAQTNPAGALGDLAAIYQFPDADGSTQDWSFVGESNAFETINQAPPDFGSRYIDAAAANDVSDFDIAPPSPVPFAVVSVTHGYYGIKTDAGAGSIQGTLDSNGSASAGADNPMTTTGAFYEDVYNVNPDGGGAWTPAALSLLGVSYERTA